MYETDLNIIGQQLCVLPEIFNIPTLQIESMLCLLINYTDELANFYELCCYGHIPELRKY
jgi:hypothetical protein